MELNIGLMIQLPISVPLTFSLSTPNFNLIRQNFLSGLIIIWEFIQENVTYYLILKLLKWYLSVERNPKTFRYETEIIYGI